MTLQVQALVAEHKLGAAGRKLGMAMQKELVNTPEHLAKVKPPASRSWAAIHKGKQKSRSAKQAEKQTSPTLTQPHEDVSEAAPAISQAAPADTFPEEAAEPVVTPPSESENEASDAVLVSGLVKEATVHFSIPETVEDSSEVSLQSCWNCDKLPQLGIAVVLRPSDKHCTSQALVKQADASFVASAASLKLAFILAADTVAC